eukprot:TRINITY_DN9391_c0_g1_i1.p1 TRINITY_DN9391_c0_g1~~TRINITY_DN9391_c0_g1_i1.p1  ORF type:complete len:111 (-),score=10.51 TRINITY_DN9391_c0_g1_i1:90-422(-)
MTRRLPIDEPVPVRAANALLLSPSKVHDSNEQNAPILSSPKRNSFATQSINQNNNKIQKKLMILSVFVLFLIFSSSSLSLLATFIDVLWDWNLHSFSFFRLVLALCFLLL